MGQIISYSTDKEYITHQSQNNDYHILKEKNGNKKPSPNPNAIPYEEVLFWSTHNETGVIYKNKKTNDMEQIQFQKQTYLCNDPMQIKYLRGLSIFGDQIFEKELPEYVKKEQEDEKRYLTKLENEYE